MSIDPVGGQQAIDFSAQPSYRDRVLALAGLKAGQLSKPMEKKYMTE